MSRSQVAVLIPARRASTRLAEKLLLAETGTPLLVHTCRQAAQAFGSGQVVVCADDEELVRVANEAGFAARMTSADHQSGTDRIAEVAATLNADIIVNVQADEPEIPPEHIRQVVELLDMNPEAGMATLAAPGDLSDQNNPNHVKVVIGAEHRALIFTRSPCPWDRQAVAPAATCHRHLGIYAYRRDLLLGYNDLPPSRLEQTEMLEQLRALEAGIPILCGTVSAAAPGIDTREDYDAFLTRFRPSATASES